MKDIKGYEGLYAVTEDGQVWSYRSQKFLKPYNKSNHGYEKVNLYKDKVSTTYCVHRLVAETYLPNPNNYPCINHKDENKLNNHANNLEWCTYKYNNNYGTHNQKLSASNSGANHPLFGKHIPEETKRKMSVANKGRVLTEETRRKISESRQNHNKAIRCVETGIVYNSTKEINKQLGIDRSRIYKCCKNSNLTTGGYHWEYYDVTVSEG